MIVSVGREGLVMPPVIPAKTNANGTRRVLLEHIAWEVSVWSAMPTLSVVGGCVMLQSTAAREDAKTRATVWEMSVAIQP